MATPAEEEQLRENYYIRCRREGYTISEASEHSLTYIRKIHNASKSLANTAYLEEAFQHSKSRPRYSSNPPPYEDDLYRHIEDLLDSMDRNRRGVSETKIDGSPSFFGDMRKQHGQNSSKPGLRAPECIPSPFDSRNNGPKSTMRSWKYTESHDRATRPRTDPLRESHYTTKIRKPYYTTEDRQPTSAYDTHTADPGHSSRSGAGPSDSPRSRVPPSHSDTRPSSPERPVPPRPEGSEPTRDLYTVLGVTRNATAAEIRKAHRALSLRWHPDRCTELDAKEATEKMAEINQANDVLCDEGRRRFYDKWGVLPNER